MLWKRNVPFVSWYLGVHVFEVAIRGNDAIFEYENRFDNAIIIQSVLSNQPEKCFSQRVSSYPAIPAPPSRWPILDLIAPT